MSAILKCNVKYKEGTVKKTIQLCKILLLTRFEDIFESISRLEEEEEGSSSPNFFLTGLKDAVIKEKNQLLSNSNLNINSLKSDWTTIMTAVMTGLNLTDMNDKIDRKAWNTILNDKSDDIDFFVKSSSSANKKSTSSLSYQAKLTLEDWSVLEANHNKMSQKWLLKSGACVENIIYEKSINFSYEHPLRSYIINTNDETWKIAFKPEADRNDEPTLLV